MGDKFTVTINKNTINKRKKGITGTKFTQNRNLVIARKILCLSLIVSRMGENGDRQVKWDSVMPHIWLVFASSSHKETIAFNLTVNYTVYGPADFTLDWWLQHCFTTTNHSQSTLLLSVKMTLLKSRVCIFLSYVLHISYLKWSKCRIPQCNERELEAVGCGWMPECLNLKPRA